MLTSEKYLKQFKDEYSFRLEEKTLYIYTLAVEQLIAHCHKPLAEITSRDIREWMSSSAVRKYKATTLKCKLAGIKLFFKYCFEEEIVSRDPTKNIPFPKWRTACQAICKWMS